MKRTITNATLLGAAIMFLGVTGATVARADDDDYARRDGRHIYRDIKDVRRDEARLRDLQRQRDQERREHEWGQVRLLDRRIADLRWHIAHDRRDIHRDVDRTHDNRYRDDYRRDRNRDDNR